MSSVDLVAQASVVRGITMLAQVSRAVNLGNAATVSRRPAMRHTASAARRVRVNASAPTVNNTRNFSSWLLKEVSSGQIDGDLATVLQSIATASKEISCMVRSAPIDGMTGVAASSNASGMQLR